MVDFVNLIQQQPFSVPKKISVLINSVETMPSPFPQAIVVSRPLISLSFVPLSDAQLLKGRRRDAVGHLAVSLNLKHSHVSRFFEINVSKYDSKFRIGFLQDLFKIYLLCERICIVSKSFKKSWKSSAIRSNVGRDLGGRPVGYDWLFSDELFDSNFDFRKRKINQKPDEK